MKSSISIQNISLTVITLLLVALWIITGIDKLWDLKAFHTSLLRQPFPSWWSDILYWSIPSLEILIGGVLLFSWGKRPRPFHIGLWFSLILLIAFTIFIALGVLGFYESRPCQCASSISSLSWGEHLWFNGFFILINGIAIWIFHSINKGDKSKQHKNKQPARSWIIKYFPYSSSVTTYNSIKFYREIFALYR